MPKSKRWRSKREQNAQSNAADVNANALRATTLPPGNELRRVVFFKRDRTCGSSNGCMVQLVMPVGATTFVFPVVFKGR